MAKLSLKTEEHEVKVLPAVRARGNPLNPCIYGGLPLSICRHQAIKLQGDGALSSVLIENFLGFCLLDPIDNPVVFVLVAEGLGNRDGAADQEEEAH